MKELEYVDGAEITKDDLVIGLTSAAKINGNDYEDKEILKLADKIMV